jgi:hypothetical protein
MEIRSREGTNEHQGAVWEAREVSLPPAAGGDKSFA